VSLLSDFAENGVWRFCFRMDLAPDFTGASLPNIAEKGHACQRV